VTVTANRQYCLYHPPAVQFGPLYRWQLRSAKAIWRAQRATFKISTDAQWRQVQPGRRSGRQTFVTVSTNSKVCRVRSALFGGGHPYQRDRRRYPPCPVPTSSIEYDCAVFNFVNAEPWGAESCYHSRPSLLAPHQRSQPYCKGWPQRSRAMPVERTTNR